MKYIILLVIFCALIGYFLFRPDGKSPSTKMGHALMREVAQVLEKRYGMEMNLIDEAGDENTYTIMGMGFMMYRILGKEEGRKILIDCVETFLDAINTDEKFQQYMSEHPFTSKNIDITLFTMFPNGDDILYPEISTFAAREGTVYFYYDSPDDPYKYQAIETESYDDAQKIAGNLE